MTHRGSGSAVTLDPAPRGGTLSVEVPCGTEVPAQAPRHPVLIRPDWTVEMPHSLEAERVAAAFGGSTPCLDLATNIVPALRHLLLVMTGQGVGRVVTRWCVHGRCLGVYVHASTQDAYRHEITPGHLAALFDLRPWQAELLLDAARAAWLADADPALVAEGPAGYEQLWAAAVHPLLVDQLADLLPPGVAPVPWRFYADVAHSSVDRDWLRAVLRILPDPSLAAFLVEHPDRAAALSLDEARDLRSLGLGPKQVHEALLNGTTAAMLRGRLEPSDADPRLERWQAEWARVGCRPLAPHAELLSRRGILHLMPARAEIDGALALCRLVRPDVDRTEVAVMLAVLGEPIHVASAVASGITSALDPRLTSIAPRGETP